MQNSKKSHRGAKSSLFDADSIEMHWNSKAGKEAGWDGANDKVSGELRRGKEWQQQNKLL